MAWIDEWLPTWQFDEVHHIRSRASGAALLDAAAAYNPEGDAFIQAALALREVPGRLAAAFGLRSTLGQRRRFGLDDFTRLGRHGDEALAYGLAGRFWEPGYGLQPLADAAAFREPAPPDSARLLLGFVVQAVEGGTQLSTLTRVHCNSAAAHRRLAVYWALIRPVSGLIRRRTLADIRRTAEAAG